MDRHTSALLAPTSGRRTIFTIKPAGPRATPVRPSAQNHEATPPADTPPPNITATTTAKSSTLEVNNTAWRASRLIRSLKIILPSYDPHEDDLFSVDTSKLDPSSAYFRVFHSKDGLLKHDIINHFFKGSAWIQYVAEEMLGTFTLLFFALIPKTKFIQFYEDVLVGISSSVWAGVVFQDFATKMKAVIRKCVRRLRKIKAVDDQLANSLNHTDPQNINNAKHAASPGLTGKLGSPTEALPIATIAVKNETGSNSMEDSDHVFTPTAPNLLHGTNKSNIIDDPN